MAHTFLEKFTAARVKLLTCHLPAWITEGSVRPTMTVQNVRDVQTKLCSGRVSAKVIPPSRKSQTKLLFIQYHITWLIWAISEKIQNLLMLQLPFREL